MENNNLIVDRKLASRISALAVLLAFVLFVFGYFVGRRQSSSDFLPQLEKESLTDQVYSSISSLYEPIQDDAQVLLDAQEELDEEQTQLDSRFQALKEPHKNGPFYYAQLASFRRMQDAKPLVERLSSKHGILTEIKEIASKSKQGRAIKWFQVITAQYQNIDELNQLIAQIKKVEKINDIVVKKENNS